MSLNRTETAVIFFAGALVGVTCGILLAPRSGVRTRSQIRRRARRGIARLDELRDDIRSQVDGWVEEVTDAVDAGLNRGRQITTMGREKVLGVFDDAKQRVDVGRSHIERLIGIP